MTKLALTLAFFGMFIGRVPQLQTRHTGGQHKTVRLPIFDFKGSIPTEIPKIGLPGEYMPNFLKN